jgi:hypothetical protein
MFRAPLPLLTLSLAVAACSSSSASSTDAAAAFVGTWNYGHPNAITGEGIAQLRCPGSGPTPLPLPQIGWVKVARTGPASLSGTTDQGCTWSFAVRDKVATLDPPSQTCFNKNIGSSYTIRDWTIAMSSGVQATESLHATSHQAVDCDFALDGAIRLRNGQKTGDLTAPFVGVWRYDPPDAVGGSTAIVSCPADDGGASPPSYAPQSGSLRVARVDDTTVSVTTDTGCASTLRIDDATAELAQPAATCAGGIVPSFWSFETNGREAFQTITGAKGPCIAVLSNSRLTKGAP